MQEFDVRTYGATGNGSTKDTSALQHAIDSCAARGGGNVFFPAGTYLTGSLYLDSHVHLQLSPGAVLLGSPDREDYNRDDFCPQNSFSSLEHVSGAHLIIAVEKNDIGIHGGRIDGNCQAWMNETSPNNPRMFRFPEWRPGQMIYFCQCQDIHIDNTKLFNAPYWTCFLHGCDNVFVHCVQIWNDARTPNGDGLDLDCCHQVTVSDCQIEGGDDCITLRANKEKLLHNRRSSEWITVSNCILSTPCNAFRIGVGNGEIRHCMVSNCLIHDSRTGICIINKYSRKAQGAEITDISFENIQLDCERPLNISADVYGPQNEPSRIMRNISFHHLRGRGNKSCFITGNPDCHMTQLTLSDVIFDYEGGRDILQARKQQGSYGAFGVKTADSALYLENIDDIELDRVQIRWNHPDGPWKEALRSVNVRNISQRDCIFPPPPKVE